MAVIPLSIPATQQAELHVKLPTGEEFAITACISSASDGALVVFIDGDHERVRVNVNDGEVHTGCPRGEEVAS